MFRYAWYGTNPLEKHVCEIYRNINQTINRSNSLSIPLKFYNSSVHCKMHIGIYNYIYKYIYSLYKYRYIDWTNLQITHIALGTEHKLLGQAPLSFRKVRILRQVFQDNFAYIPIFMQDDKMTLVGYTKLFFLLFF